MPTFLSWLDDNLLAILAGFLLVFIPLYPKIPLADILPGYIVRLRLEDVFIAITIGVYAVQVVRKKAVFWKTPLTKPILVYLSLGVLSLISGIVLVGSIPLETIHINKAVLHFLRRIEYFSLFFIFFSATRTSLSRVKLFLILYLGAVFGVIIYGYGQKYLYWCAFSTMNREFSKGWCLYLTEHARVISTFGGHYDLAAFIMVATAILWSLIIGSKTRISKAILFLLLAGSLWTIILTASRISFIAYMVALTVVFFVWMFKKGIGWTVSRWFWASSLSILVMLSFGDLSDRFLRILKLEDRFGGIRRLVLQPIGTPPEKSRPFIEIPDGYSLVTSKSDQPPSTVKPGAKPADVKNDLPDYINVINEQGQMVVVPVRRTFSNTALRFDLSTGIRLDVLWPRAWEGFIKNPLFGSGYSTLTKSRPTDFTEAESTDNGFLRALGETGALGTVSFFAIITSALLLFWWALPGVRDSLFFAFLIGGMAAIIGLLINTLYIDVFEASKIALPFWALVGVMLGGIAADTRRITEIRRPLRLHINLASGFERIKRFIQSDKFFLLILVGIAFWLRTYRLNYPIADWHSWRQADTAAVSRNYFSKGINLLYPTYDDLSSVASGQPNPRGLRMVEFPLYNAISAINKKFFAELTIDESGRLTSIFASLASLVFTFLLVRKYHGRRAAFLGSFFFAILPFNIYYSRAILPEPSAVAASTGMLYFFDRWMESRISSLTLKPIIFYLLSLLFAAAALLIKPYTAFLFLPVFYLVFRNSGWKGLFHSSTILFFVVSIIPFLWWRWWIGHFPEGIPAYTWLLNGDGIRFKGAFFYWIFADRMGRLILGYWGVALLVFGLLSRPKEKGSWFFHVWLISIVLYLFTFATGNVRHDYYQTITIPIIAIFLGLGAEVLLTLSKELWNKRLAYFVGVISIAFMLSFSWYFIRDFFNVNHWEIVEAGSEVEKLTHERALVIAPYDGDTAFLYQTKRAGWPLVEGTIDEMAKKGAQYYVSVKEDELTKELIREAVVQGEKKVKPYKLLKKTAKYTIIQLVPDQELPH